MKTMGTVHVERVYGGYSMESMAGMAVIAGEMFCVQAFVEVCMKYHNKQEALKDLSRVTPEHKVRCLVRVG